MTKQRFICPTFGPICEEAEIIMRISRATVENAGHEWLAPNFEAAASPREAAISKDLYVFEMAQRPEYADTVFLDWDMEIRQMWDMQPEQPYFIYEWGTPRIGMFAVNGCTQWFLDLQADKERRGILDVFGYPNKLLRDKKPEVVPERCYMHHRFTSGAK